MRSNDPVRDIEEQKHLLLLRHGVSRETRLMMDRISFFGLFANCMDRSTAAPPETIQQRFVEQLLSLCLICSIVLLGLSCSPNLNQSNSKTTVTVLFDVDEYTWATWEYHTQLLVFLPLGDRGLTPGSLAESWEHSEDYSTWTVKLRDGVRWHDGVPVTADDVQFTLDLYSNPEVLKVPPDSYSMRILDPRRYTVHLNQTSGGMIGSPLDGYRKILPKHLLEDLDPGGFSSWDFWTHPVGNGPYRYVRHVPKTFIEFEANPDYYRGKPKIERVILKFGYPSVTQLLSGEVDIIGYVNREELGKIANDPRFEIYGGFSPRRIYVLGFNQRSPLFRDIKVRQALTMAIDRGELHSLINLPGTTQIFEGIITQRQYDSGEILDPLPYDPKRAARLLSEAGWRDSDGDGILDRSGTAFRFRAVAENSYGLDKAAVFIQSRLRNLGIEMDIVSGDWAGAQAALFKGDYEAAVFSMTPFGGGLNLGKVLDALGYTNSKLFDKLEKRNLLFDPDKIEDLYRETSVVLREDLPFVTLYPLATVTAAHRRVRGLRNPDRVNAVAFMGELWIDEK